MSDKPIRKVLEGSCKGLLYRESDRGGLEWSNDKGLTWYLTWRSWRDVEEMHASLEPFTCDTTDEEREREIFGETLDEEIPDWAWEEMMEPVR